MVFGAYDSYPDNIAVTAVARFEVTVAAVNLNGEIPLQWKLTPVAGISTHVLGKVKQKGERSLVILSPLIRFLFWGSNQSYRVAVISAKKHKRRRRKRQRRKRQSITAKREKS